MNIKIPTQKYKKLPTRNKYFYQSKQIEYEYIENQEENEY